MGEDQSLENEEIIYKDQLKELNQRQSIFRKKAAEFVLRQHLSLSKETSQE
jgi:hypothetical protein